MIKIKNTFTGDFTLHVYAGIIITVISGLASYIYLEAFLSGVIGLAVGNIAGFAKEYIWDLWLKKGTFNKQDIFATFWGACIGTVILAVIFNIHNGV